MRKTALFFVLLGILAAFHSATIRAGNPWGDDWALYILHARNLSSGLPYAETGYLYNPQVPQYGPRIYPPVFPLLLAPVYRLAGLNFWWMKLEQVAFLVLALGAICLLWRRELPVPCMLALLAVVGFNPHVWEMKDSVLSDLPFLFFFYAAVLVLTWVPRNRWQWAAVAGFTLYLAGGTRTIGIMLVAGLLLHDLLRVRRITAFSAAASIVCVALLTLQRRIIGPGQASYADQFHPTLASVAGNAVSYMRTAGFFWLGADRPLAILLFLAASIAACFGFHQELKHRRLLLPSLLLPYLLMIVLWPSFQGLRFLLPAIPYFLYLALLGVNNLAPGTYARLAVAILSIAIAFTYVQGFRRASFRTIAEADGLSSFRELCRSVESETRPQEAIVFERPRMLALFTGRSAATYAPGTDDDLWRQIDTLQARYLVSGSLFANDRSSLIPFVQRHRNELDVVFQNRDFQLLRIRRPASATGLAVKVEPSDSRR